MTKCMVFLYPIYEYFHIFLLQDKNLLTELNDTIMKRYKNKGYKIFVTLFNDTSLYGIYNTYIDGIIDVGANFQEFTNIKGKISEDEIEFPSLDKMFDSILHYDEIVVTGFHFNSCVKKALEYLKGQNKLALVDLDLTENFSYVHNSIFFNKEEYNPDNFKKSMIEYFSKYQSIEDSEHEFAITFNNPLFGFPSDYIPDDPSSIELYLKRADKSVIREFIIKRLRKLRIDDYDIDIYLKLLVLISKRLRYEGIDLLLLISEVIAELDASLKPKIVDNIFKILGFVSNLVLCDINGYKEVVNIYYPIYGVNHPLVIYRTNHSISFIDYNGTVIKCPFFIPLSEENGMKFVLGENIKCNIDKSVSMLMRQKSIPDSFEANPRKLLLTYISEIDIEKV